MRKLAAQRAKELTIRGDQTRAILSEQFSDATPETLADAATILKQASDRADELAQTLARAKELETERETTAARGAAFAGLADRFAEIQQDAAAGSCRRPRVAGCTRAGCRRPRGSSRRGRRSPAAASRSAGEAGQRRRSLWRS